MTLNKCNCCNINQSAASLSQTEQVTKYILLVSFTASNTRIEVLQTNRVVWQWAIVDKLIPAFI